MARQASAKKKTGIPFHKKTLRSIDLSLIGMDAYASFPLYGRNDASTNDYSLLLPKGGRISKAFRRRVQEEYGGKVYIFSEHWSAYNAQVEETVSEIIGDAEKSLEEKSAAFYAYGTDRLEEAFRRISAEGGKKVTLVQPIAENALNMVRNDWKGLFSVFKLAKAAPQTYTHSLNVCFFGLSYVHNFLPSFSDREIKEIAIGFLCHDIGETKISESILNKTKDLTPWEQQIMQQVPMYGVQVLKETGCDYPLAEEIILYHRERMDGSGYPQGVAKDQIPILARICAVCEAFDTMTSPKFHRQGGLTSFDALKQMVREEDGRFDREVLVNFVNMMGARVDNMDGQAALHQERPPPEKPTERDWTKFLDPSTLISTTD